VLMTLTVNLIVQDFFTKKHQHRTKNNRRQGQIHRFSQLVSKRPLPRGSGPSLL